MDDTRSMLLQLLVVIDEFDVPEEVIIKAVPEAINLMLIHVVTWVDQQPN